MSEALVPVYVHDDEGSVHYFSPGDSLPDWAVAKITNPAVIGTEVDIDDQAPVGQPEDTWTVKELREFADVNGIDLGAATKKSEILAILNGEN